MKSIVLKSAALVALCTAVVQAGPNVDITKQCPSLRYLGRNATFTITITNTGDAAAESVVVRDTVTGGMQFISADNNGSRQGNNIVWNLGTLAAGASKTLSTTMKCTVIGMVENNAEVTYCAKATAACSFPVKGIPAILLECVDNPDPMEVGGQVTYTITVVNQGSAMGTNITIKCTLPTEEQFVSGNGPTEASASGQVITFAPLPSLSPKAKATYHLVVKGVAQGDVRFKVEMNSDQINTPVMETESTNFYE